MLRGEEAAPVGEGAGFFLMTVDWPLMYLALNFRSLTDFFDSHDVIFIMYLGIGGTLMYALVGWIIGWLWDYSGRLPQKP